MKESFYTNPHNIKSFEMGKVYRFKLDFINVKSIYVDGIINKFSRNDKSTYISLFVIATGDTGCNLLGKYIDINSYQKNVEVLFYLPPDLREVYFEELYMDHHLTYATYLEKNIFKLYFLTNQRNNKPIEDVDLSDIELEKGAEPLYRSNVVVFIDKENLKYKILKNRYSQKKALYADCRCEFISTNIKENAQMGTGSLNYIVDSEQGDYLISVNKLN